MEYNSLSDAQKDQIRKVVNENSPECKMVGEIKLAKIEKEKEPSSITEAASVETAPDRSSACCDCSIF